MSDDQRRIHEIADSVNPGPAGAYVRSQIARYGKDPLSLGQQELGNALDRLTAILQYEIAKLETFPESSFVVCPEIEHHAFTTPAEEANYLHENYHFLDKQDKNKEAIPIAIFHDAPVTKFQDVRARLFIDPVYLLPDGKFYSFDGKWTRTDGGPIRVYHRRHTSPILTAVYFEAGLEKIKEAQETQQS